MENQMYGVFWFVFFLGEFDKAQTCAFSPATRLLQTVRSLPKLLR